MNKLDRIKRVLSADSGTKFPTPIITKQNNGTTLYSGDGGKTWYLDKDLKLSAGFITDLKELKLVDPYSSNNNLETEIPGLPDLTPTTAVETAALASEAAANKTLFYADPDANTINLDIKGLSMDLLKEDSKGMHLISELNKQETTQKLKLLSDISNGATAVFLGIGTAIGALQTTTDSNTTKTANLLYNATTDVVEKMGPVGKIVGTALKNAAVAGDIMQSMGGGTDQMTSTDKWMDSSLLSWNIGAINGFGGKRTDTLAVDYNTLENVGSSYGGTSADIMNAASKSGKKYGLFSSGARKRANRAIADARNKQDLMADISDEATDQRLAVLSMGELAGLAYSIMTDGGYNQKYTYAAKHGGTLEWNPEITLEWEPKIELNWELPAFKKGGQISEELEWVPEFLDGGKTRTLEELIEYAKKENPRFIQRLSESPKGINFVDEKGKNAQGSHLLGYELDEEGNAIVFPSIQEMEDGNLKYLSLWDAYDRAIEKKNFLKMTPEEAKLFTESGEDELGNLFGYKKGWPKFFLKFKNGGKTEESDIPEIEETSLKNVIPEGALHKNKHHMEHSEGLTKKGIPVIDEDGELQAEIELNEIIFTLEVTKKLEEYYEVFYSEDSTNKEKELAALEAGKLLVYEILENTDDRTGLIESCKLGGALTLKKSTDDLIEEALEWIPNIMIIEETIEKTVEEKPKKEKPEKELMKEAIKEVLIELLTK